MLFFKGAWYFRIRNFLAFVDRVNVQSTYRMKISIFSIIWRGNAYSQWCRWLYLNSIFIDEQRHADCMRSLFWASIQKHYWRIDIKVKCSHKSGPHMMAFLKTMLVGYAKWYPLQKDNCFEKQLSWFIKAAAKEHKTQYDKHTLIQGNMPWKIGIYLCWWNPEKQLADESYQGCQPYWRFKT